MKSNTTDVDSLYFTIQRNNTTPASRKSPSFITAKRSVNVNSQDCSKAMNRNGAYKQITQKPKVIIKLKQTGSPYPAY